MSGCPAKRRGQFVEAHPAARSRGDDDCRWGSRHQGSCFCTSDAERLAVHAPAALAPAIFITAPICCFVVAPASAMASCTMLTTCVGGQPLGQISGQHFDLGLFVGGEFRGVRLFQILQWNPAAA